MNNRVNSLGQPIGYQVPHWKAVNPPPRAPIAGRYCRIEPIDIDRHAADLFEAISDDTDGRSWTYMAYGPFGTLPEYRAWMKTTCLGDDPLFHAIIDTATNKAVGVASYLRIDPKFGVIETGHIHYSPAPAAHARRDRDDVSHDAPGVRGARLSPLRMEVRCAERTLAPRSRAPRLQLRRRSSARPPSTRAATATPPGSRSSTMNGRP